MAFLTYADRVAETTTTTGTGTIQLAGAVDAKFRTFVAGVGSGATVPYVVVHRTANEWEVGYGVVTAGSPNTLTRAGIYSSSNSNNAVNLSTGTKDVFLSLPGSKTVRFDDATGGVTLGAGLAVDGASGNVLLNNQLGADGLSVDAFGDNLSFGEGSGVSYANIFRQSSSAATIIANGYKRSANANAFASSVGSSWAKTAIGLGVGTGDIRFYTDTAATVANGTDVTPTERARITSGGNLIPGANNAYSFGDGSTRWTEIFAVSGTINTSDAEAKTDIEEDVPSWDFVQALRPVSYRWKVRKNEIVQVEDGTETVEIPAELDDEGNEIAPARTEERPTFRTETIAHPGVRRHLGFLAQDVKQALGDADYGLYIYNEESDEHGLRYDQFAPVLVKTLQEAMTRIEALETRLAALEGE